MHLLSLKASLQLPEHWLGLRTPEHGNLLATSAPVLATLPPQTPDISSAIIPDTITSVGLRFMYILSISVDVLCVILVALVIVGMKPADINILRSSEVLL